MTVRVAGGTRTPPTFPGTRCWADDCARRASGWSWDHPYCSEHLAEPVACPVCADEIWRRGLRRHLFAAHPGEVEG